MSDPYEPRVIWQGAALRPYVENGPTPEDAAPLP